MCGSLNIEAAELTTSDFAKLFPGHNTRMRQIAVQRINRGGIKEAQKSHGDLQHAFAFHDDLL